MENVKYQKLLIALLIPIVIGFLIWLILRDTMNAIIITLLITIISLNIESRMYQEDIYTIIEIQPLLENPRLKKRLSSMAKNYQKISAHKEGDFFHRTAQEYTDKVINECESTIANLNRGYMHIDKNDIIREKEKLIGEVKGSLFATSVDALMTDFWENPHGERYRQLNREAILRGVGITRVFIVHNEETLKNNDRLLSEIKTQIADGVDAKVVFYNLLGNNAIKDFGIWDDTLVFYIHCSHDNEMLDSDIFIDEIELKKAKDLRTLILSQAKPASDYVMST